MEMNLITIFFQIVTLAAVISNIFNYFEKYMPNILLRTIKFRRSSVGLESSVFLLEVPKRWFTHFYIFAFSFSTLTLFTYWKYTSFLQHFLRILFDSQPCIPNDSALLASILIWFQVFRRLYECLFISEFSKIGKMNILIYIIGYLHYFGAITSCFGDSSCNECSFLKVTIAVLLFIFARIKQLHSNTILVNLRQGLTGSTNEYKIPFGGLFEYVSCPNHFCEILIYISYTILFGFKNVVVNWVTVWVILNQIFLATVSHNWYHTKFGDKYPKQRKALIPFIF